jgi:hypothetical protein
MIIENVVIAAPATEVKKSVNVELLIMIATSKLTR